jgi:hypothetical protein
MRFKVGNIVTVRNGGEWRWWKVIAIDGQRMKLSYKNNMHELNYWVDDDVSHLCLLGAISCPICHEEFSLEQDYICPDCRQAY